MEALFNLDRALFVAINNGLSATPLDTLFALLSWVGEGYMLALLGALGLFLFDGRRFPKNLVVFGLIILASGTINQGFKSAFNKPRPMGDAALVQGIELIQKSENKITGIWRQDFRLPETSKFSGIGDGTIHVVGSAHKRRGFPSGHTVASLGFALCMIYGFRRKIRYFWLLFPVGVGLSRIYVGVHFPLDVLGGAVIGFVLPYAFLLRTEKYHGLGARKRPRSGGEKPTVMIVAGEASADLYGGDLIRKMKARRPELSVFGAGGKQMVEAGLDLIHDSHELSIVGFTGAVTAAPRIRRIYKDLIKQMRIRKPQVLVTIDLPDFNLMLANQAQSLGVRVVYYISPQIWAWREERIHTIAERVDRMIVAFPFELEFYREAGLEADFFGHPMMEHIDRDLLPSDQAFDYFGMDPNRKVFVIAPGSRKNEIKYLARPLFEAGRLLAEKLPDWQFAVPVAPNVDAAELAEIARQVGFSATFPRDRIHDLLNIASFGIITSGTATLEAALLRCPMFIVYRGHPINVAIARRMIKIDHIGLPNIVAGKDLFPEMLQDQATGPNLAERAISVLGDPQAYQALADGCEIVRNALSADDTSEKVAGLVLELTKPKLEDRHGSES